MKYAIHVTIAVLLAIVLGSCGRRPLSALENAVRAGDLDAIRELAKAGASLNLQDANNGWTPLIHAVHTRQTPAVLLLIDLGADVNGRARGGYTALMMAAGYGHTKTVQALLAKGADPRLESTDGISALAEAVGGVPDIDAFTVGSCQTETVRALLTAAPDLRLKDNSSGRRAKMFAKIAGCKEVLALLQNLPGEIRIGKDLLDPEIVRNPLRGSGF